MEPWILLTVPHGHPEDDQNAPPVARALAGKLSGHLKAKLLLNGMSRKELDGNRIFSRKTPFRLALAEAVAAQPSLLLDIHSFPPSIWPEDIVLLHTPGVQCPDHLEEYAADLRETAAALDKKVEVAIRPARFEDDINIHARQLGLPDDALMLVEHRDGSDAELHATMHFQAIHRLMRRRHGPHFMPVIPGDAEFGGPSAG